MRALSSIVSHATARFPRAGAFYTLSPPRVAQTLQLWRTQLPTVQPFYAVKCNPEPLFLNMLYDAGASFDCASERELISIRELARANTAQRVVYANPCKSLRDLEAAKQVGSPITVVDSVEEVEKLAAANYSGGALLRLAVDDSGSAMPFSSKFGCAGGDVTRVIGAAGANRIPLYGVSFHVGSGCRDGSLFRGAIQQAMGVLGLLGPTGRRHVLDIGGGFLPIEGDFRHKALHIRSALRTVPSDIDVWAEPGRFMAANVFDFYVQVIGKKRSSGGSWNYTVDDSLYGQFSNILFDQASPVWVRIGEGRRPVTKGTIFGRTCDSLDKIATARCMEELEVGDWLYLPAMGAYTRATASEFNGFPTPDVLVLEPHQRAPALAELAERLPIGIEYPVRAPAGATATAATA